MGDKSQAADGFEVLNLSGALDFLGDTHAVRDLLGPLAQSLDKDIADLGRLIKQSDVNAVAALLHSLKGFIPIFCFPAFSAQLTHVEKALRGPGDVKALLAQAGALLLPLQRLVQEAKVYLAQSA